LLKINCRPKYNRLKLNYIWESYSSF
jgi:hypothetical protein